MARLRWLFPVVLVAVAGLGACKRKQQDKPAPTRPVDASALPDRGSAEVLPAQKVTAVGDALFGDAAQAAGQPALAVDAADAPVVAWNEGGKVLVRRWNGTAWEALAASPSEAMGHAQGEPTLAAEADGGVLLSWHEAPSKDPESLQVARWKGGAWTSLGGVGGGGAVLDGEVAASELGPVVVWREAGGKPGQLDVHTAALGGNGWAPLGDGLMRGAPDATTKVAAALATRPGAPVVVGWIESSPAPVAQLRRWDNTAKVWQTLPPPPGADAQSSLSLAMTPDGAIHAAMGYTVGLRQLVSLPSGGKDWKTIGVPESANGEVTHQRLVAGADGRIVFTYPFGGRYAYWDGRRWSPTSVGVVSPSTVAPAAAVAGKNVVYVAWSDSVPGSNQPDHVHVFRVE